MDSFLKSIELDRVLEIVALEAKTIPGKEAIRTRRPSTSLPECERQQVELAEMRRYFLSEGLLPFAGLIDVVAFFDREAVLELDESWQILRAARATQAIRESLVRTDTYRRLAELASSIPDLSEFVSAVGRYFNRDGKLREEASADLRSIRSKVQAKRSAIQRTLTDLMNRHADAIQDPIITIRGDRYCIPVRTERRSEITGILHERSGSGQSFFIEPLSIVEANNDLAQLMIEEREEIARITRFIAGRILESAKDIAVAVEVSGELDAIQACAVIGQTMQATRPEFSDDRHLRIIDARHPLIDERLADLRHTAFGERDQTRVVPTTIEISRTTPALVISGPNAGGKTVALKTAGLLVAMATAGLPVPASDGTVIPVPDQLFVLIGDDQNVMEHLSTFSAYLVRLRRILELATPDSLVLLDELGSGTDPEEGAALAASVIEELLDRTCLTIVTTHVSALKSFAVSDSRIANASMEFDSNSGEPSFRLIMGVPGRSRAIEAAARVGLPSRLIDRARKRLGERYADMDKLLADLQKTMSELVTERDAVRRSVAQLDRERSEVDKLRGELDEEKKRLAGSMRDKFDKLRDEVSHRLDSELKKVRELDRKSIEKARASRLAESVLRPLEAEEPPTGGGALRVGDRAQHRRFKIVGVISAIADDKATLAVGNKKMQVDREDLLPIDDKPKPLAPKQPKVDLAAARDIEPAIAAELNLIGQRVDDAIEESDKFIDRSLLEGKPAVRLIHGFGTGALRKALREHLRKHPGVRSFRPGADNEGGDGATIAILDL